MEGAILSFNREMGERFGIAGALIYQELVRKQFYWEKQGKLVDGWFYEDQSAIGEWVLCHPDTVSRAVKPIIDAGLLEKKIGYKPGTTVRTTWWRVRNPNYSVSEPDLKSISEPDSKSISILNQKESNQYSVAKTEKTDLEPSEPPAPASNETSTAREEVRMLPQVLLKRVRSLFPGSRVREGKRQLATIKALQERLDDETIIAGFRALKQQECWHFDGYDKPITLAGLLLTDDYNKLERNLLVAAEEGNANKRRGPQNVD